MKLTNLTSIFLGIFLGLITGGLITWSFTKDFIDKAVVKSELRFEELLEKEKEKVKEKIEDITSLETNRNDVILESELKCDSLNTSIENKNKQIRIIRKKYNEELSNINGMSHNELTDFFSNRYKY